MLRRERRLEVGLRCLGGHQGGIGKQCIGQRLQPGFLGQLALGAALEFERQVNIFHFLLGSSVVDGSHQRRRQLALLVNRLAHGFLAVGQLTQVGEPGFQLAQLDIVQPAGHFFAVAGDKGHGGAFVQQGYGGFDLLGANLDFLRDLRDDFLHCEKLASQYGQQGINQGRECATACRA